LFTRDIGAAIPGAFIVCHAATKARQRETLLMRYVLLKHPLFANTTFLDVRDFASEVFWYDTPQGGPVSIEGGRH
jgi:arginine deiminase